MNDTQNEKLESYKSFSLPFQVKGPMDIFQAGRPYTVPQAPAFTQPMSSDHRGQICKACSGEKLTDEPFCNSCFYSLLPGMRNQLRQPVGEWGRAFWEAKRYLADKHRVTFMSGKQRTVVQGVAQITGAIILSDGRCITSSTPFTHLMIDHKLMATVDSAGFIDCLIAVFPDGSLRIIFRDGLPLALPVEITFERA